MDTGELFSAALKHQQSGDLTQAEALYRTLVTANPRHAGALRQLGILAGQIGKPPVAVQLLAMAIEIQPRDPVWYNDLGNALKACGHFAEAQASYQTAIAFNSRYADAHFNLGNLYRLQKDFNAAVESYERAIALSPMEADAHNNLGTALLDLGQPEKAEQAFLRAIALNPLYAEACYNLGNALAARGDHPGAISWFDRALRIKSDHAKAHLNRGVSQAALGDAEAGMASFARAIELSPGDAVAHNNLGMALLDGGRRAEAKKEFRQAIALDACYAEAHFNLGNALSIDKEPRQMIECFNQSLKIRPDYAKAYQNRGASQEATGDLESAAASYREALACEPGSTDILSNLGQVLAFQGDAQGIAYLEQIVEKEPASAKAHWNLALALLLHGDYKRGWQEYEWRWRCAEWPPRQFAQPQWQGDSLGGATILLHAEQGLGDTLQFARYVPLVVERFVPCGGRVVLEVQPSLQSLMRNIPGVDLCLRQGDPLPDFSCHFPLMSLPLVFATSLETIPAPLLHRPTPHDSKQGDAASRLANMGTKQRVGLVWSGNPEHLRDRLRSVHLEEFRSLFELPDVSIVSLQQGPPIEQRAKAHLPFYSPDRIGAAQNFADTARIIASLDLVISVDTAVAHLAGSMGKPVWVLLSNLPDWRWGLGRESTPWYPTARLFRQHTPADWAGVIKRVATKLKGFASAKKKLAPASLSQSIEAN